MQLHSLFEQGQESALRQAVVRLTDTGITELRKEIAYIDQAAGKQFDTQEHPLRSYIDALDRAIAARESIVNAVPVDWTVDEAPSGQGVTSTPTSGGAGSIAGAASLGTGSSVGGGGGRGAGGSSGGSGGGGGGGGGTASAVGAMGPPASPTVGRNPGLRPADTSPVPSASVDPAQAIATRDIAGFYLIGGSSIVVSNRTVGWNIKPEGWQGFVDKFIKADLNNGYRRIHLHNPFGAQPNEPMDADQYIEATEAGLTWLTAGFVEAWQPVVQGQYTGGQAVEVIAYFGSFRTDKDFVALYEGGDLDAWFKRAWASLKPALDAGMSIGLDAVSPAPVDHPVYTLAKQLVARGVKVYIETWPLESGSHWGAFNLIIDEPFYKHLVRRRWTDHVKPQDIQGDVLVIIREPFKSEAEIYPSLGVKTKQFGAELMARGFHISVCPYYLNQDDVYPTDVAREVLARQAHD